MRSHVVLTHEDWNKFRPLVLENKIKFEASGYRNNVYISFEVNQEEYNKIDELLEKI